MPLILNIDTAQDIASFCIAKDGVIAAFAENNSPTQQAGWLQPALQAAFDKYGIGMQALDAIAVSNGPGSYTGLRIGLAAAKGMCFALAKPLITLNTLQVMAAKAQKAATADFICPMIDARRMEVYTAMYNKDMETILPPQAMILDTDSFKQWLRQGSILFTGSGTDKFQKILTHPNAVFVQKDVKAWDMVPLAEIAFAQGRFADVAYSEPDYIKAVYIR